ncbi:RNA-directed DNA polymerase [Clostridium thermosuccinogenes]|uniref:RNA-directed DNA polymerase n=1 Tax=Clostridium thermosuccinogenes TaxID=84032 RepID=UPI0013747D02|nr:RNA-directed DNA polymerase [Pseudoclostridium thermosuccinogenes]
MLVFPIDKSGWTKEELDIVKIGNEKTCKGIPTGLFVAGFLANLALLDIDNRINNLLNNDRRIAHFRFVDDHVFIADSYDKLKAWIKQFEDLLNESRIGVDINYDKIEPEQLRNFVIVLCSGVKSAA